MRLDLRVRVARLVRLVSPVSMELTVLLAPWVPLVLLGRLVRRGRSD